MLKLSIKTYMIIFLLILAAVGIYLQKELVPLLLQLAIAVFAAVILDLAINYFKNKKAILPSSAVITGLIVGMVMAPKQNIIFYVLAPSLAILSKHIIKFKGKHIFNPANFGLLLVNIFFGAYMGWWLINIWFVILAGLFITLRIRRLQIVVSYLLVMAILLVAYANINQGEAFDYFPLINLYFVFVMLIEPRTSPFKLWQGIIFGCIVAAAGFISYLFLPRYDYLLVGLALGNLSNLLIERFKK